MGNEGGPHCSLTLVGRLNPVVELNDTQEGSRHVRHLQAGAEHILNFQKGPTDHGFLGCRLFLKVLA